ncbi:polysaccharide deacetylase family protein [Coprobacter sp.]
MKVIGQTGDTPKVRIAPFKGDKLCAISYTFDDAVKDQSELAVPMLEEFGFRGTFWAIPATIPETEEEKLKNPGKKWGGITWKRLKEMSDNGHEISNHGWSHKNLANLKSEQEIRAEIEKADSLIFLKIGKKPRTFCYPYNAYNDQVLAIAMENRVDTRTRCSGWGYRTTTQWMNNWADGLIKKGEWGITMIHAIIDGFDAFPSKDVLYNHLAHVKKREDKIWIGTFLDVASYIKEAENVRLSVIPKKNGVICKTEMTLDKNLFMEPLTLVVEAKNVVSVKATQKGKKLPAKIEPDKICIDFMPGEAPVKISWKND